MFTSLMRWISDGASIERMIERSSRLTGDELRALAERYDDQLSHSLRAPVAADLSFGMAWDMLPPQVHGLCDVVADAARRAGLPPPVAMRAWQAIADAMTARLFPDLPAPSIEALDRPWHEVADAQSVWCQVS